jgi:hypothetical protein
LHKGKIIMRGGKGKGRLSRPIGSIDTDWNDCIDHKRVQLIPVPLETACTLIF